MDGRWRGGTPCTKGDSMVLTVGHCQFLNTTLKLFWTVRDNRGEDDGHLDGAEGAYVPPLLSARKRSGGKAGRPSHSDQGTSPWPHHGQSLCGWEVAAAMCALALLMAQSLHTYVDTHGCTHMHTCGRTHMHTYHMDTRAHTHGPHPHPCRSG